MNNQSAGNFDLNPLSTQEISDAQELLKPMLRKKRMVEVTILVPLEDIDFSQCSVDTYNEPSEAWGATEWHTTYEIDLGGAQFDGHDITFEGDNYSIAEGYLLEERV